MDLDRLKIDRGTAPAPRRRTRLPVGWIGTLLVLAGLAYLFHEPALDLVDRMRLPEVDVVRVRRSSGLAASSVSGTAANGYIVARHRAALSADTPGRIVEMNVQEGSVVHAGDVVARLYAAEYEAALRQAQADLAAARQSELRTKAQAAAARAQLAELRSRASAAEARLAEATAGVELAELDDERARMLVSDNVVSRERVDNTRAELAGARARQAATQAALEEARAALATGESNVLVAEASVAEAHARIAVLEAACDLARATLDKTFVRAPFDGIVVLKDAEVGEVVSPNSLGGNSRGSVVTMVDFDSLEVQVEVPETSLAAVELGAPANVYLDAFPARPYTGRVDRVWPTANRQKATVEVRVRIDRTDELLRPEMGARVVFSPSAPAQAGDGSPDEAAGEPRILIPSSCLVRVEGRTGVFALERDVARFVELATGAEAGGRVVVESGLVGGETIVDDPPLSLEDGDRVRIP